MKSIIHIQQASKRRGIGNKALSLYTLYKKKFPVPETFVIPMDVQEAYISQPQSLRMQLHRDLEKYLDLSRAYAVRSSGEIEDSRDHSYAGQFSTFLDIQGTDQILDAVEKVWISADKLRENDYTADVDPKEGRYGMAVVIQEMITAVWSGVLFSINPVTGRNECVIEAVRGSGEQLVQEGINPERWIWHQGCWDSENDVASELKPSLEELLLNIPRLRNIFGGEVDIEWCFDGSSFYYLQCRPVTAGKFPNIYSNHISREVLPGMIKPLVWSINIPLVNSAWIKLLEGMLGNLNIHPEELSKSFYYRAYFNMGTLGSIFQLIGLPRDSLESLMGRKDPSGKSSFKPGLKSMRYLPSILGFLLRNLSLSKKFDRRFAYLTQQTDVLADEMKNFSIADYSEYFKKIQSIASEAAYYNIIIPLSMQISNRMLQGKLEKRDIPFAALNFANDFPLLNEYSPGEHIASLQDKWSSLSPEIRDRVKNYEDLHEQREQEAFRSIYENIQHLLLHFGHFSESGNDFSYMPWREDPDFLFREIKKGLDESANAGRQSETLSMSSQGIPRRAYRRAGRFRLYREMISSEYTRSYGLFRILFLKTGEYLRQQACLDEAKDVFYLTLEEHDFLMKEAKTTNEGSFRETIDAASIRKKVHKVKEEMKSFQDIILPSVIYGDSPPPLPEADEDVMTGIATSPGIFEGRIVVVKGYKDFNKKVDGNILVIPFSDVGWTPLLVRAGAIVSESGGMLSHASIVARELAIPAISSVDHACSLKDGVRARIDGFTGKLILEK